METPLSTADPEIFALIAKEKNRQRYGLEMIASENFTSQAVLDCLGSCLTNKYSEGTPGHRYYGGNEFIDQIEVICQERALKAFGLQSEEWHVNVQAYSGSPANFAVYTGLLSPHDRLMGLDLASGGHLTHGFYTPKKRISASSLFFESFPYHVDEKSGLIDFDFLQRTARIYRPKLIVCGASAYPREIPFAKFREIADSVGAMLMADISHISGLVATGQHCSPFPHCDIVTSTTHKTLRGPRSALIFVNKVRLSSSAAEKIDLAVFPGLQGGPHNHQIAAVAVQLKQVMTPEFESYCKEVIANCKALGHELMANGQKLVTGGTDNHLILWDLKDEGISGSKFEKIADYVGISLNKNTIPGDVSALTPSGVRIGTAALTSRGCGTAEMVIIAGFLLECLLYAKEVRKACKSSKLADFEAWLPKHEKLRDLKSRIAQFAGSLAPPAGAGPL